MYLLLNAILVAHFLCGILNVYREIFETKLGLIGQIMRSFEMFCIFF